MPPTGGQGAATAIIDADILCHELLAAVRGDKAVTMAVNDFYSQMRTYAGIAVVESLRPVSWIRSTNNPVGATILRTVLPIVTGLSAAQTAASSVTARLRR